MAWSRKKQRNQAITTLVAAGLPYQFAVLLASAAHPYPPMEARTERKEIGDAIEPFTGERAEARRLEANLKMAEFLTGKITGEDVAVYCGQVISG